MMLRLARVTVAIEWTSIQAGSSWSHSASFQYVELNGNVRVSSSREESGSRGSHNESPDCCVTQKPVLCNDRLALDSNPDTRQEG